MNGNDASLHLPSTIRQAAEDDSEVYLLGLRAERHPGSWSLLFFEAIEEDDYGESGMDTYCLVIAPGQMSYYGGVREWELTDGRLRLLLTRDAAEELGLSPEIVFALELVEEQRHLLERGLTRVLTSGRADQIPQRVPTVQP